MGHDGRIHEGWREANVTGQGSWTTPEIGGRA